MQVKFILHSPDWQKLNSSEKSSYVGTTWTSSACKGVWIGNTTQWNTLTMSRLKTNTMQVCNFSPGYIPTVNYGPWATFWLHLFGEIKFYWNTAMSTYLHTVYGCFHATMKRWSGCNSHHPTKSKIFSVTASYRKSANLCSGSLLLKLQCAHGSPGNLVKTQLLTQQFREEPGTLHF